jgi:hypothetical protein
VIGRTEKDKVKDVEILQSLNSGPHKNLPAGRQVGNCQNIDVRINNGTAD